MSFVSPKTVEILRDEISKLDEKLVEMLVKRVDAISEIERLCDDSSLSRQEIFSSVIALAPKDKRDLIYNVYERIYAENTGFIETVARAVIIDEGKILLCKSKGGSKYYLPGGHIDFGENSRQALKREISEETSCSAEIGDFLGVLENSFIQDGKNHQEINLIYKARITDKENFKVLEPWIEYDWVNLQDLNGIALLPEDIKRYCK